MQFATVGQYNEYWRGKWGSEFAIQDPGVGTSQSDIKFVGISLNNTLYSSFRKLKAYRPLK